MRNANRVGNDYKSKAAKHQSRASKPSPARKRKQVAKASPATRGFLAESVERAAKSANLESALAGMHNLRGVVEQVPGLEKEAAMLRGASAVSALLRACTGLCQRKKG